jgi:hypothetical protein
MVGAEVTRLEMLWKSAGLEVEEMDILTSAPTFETRSHMEYSQNRTFGGTQRTQKRQVAEKLTLSRPVNFLIASS